MLWQEGAQSQEVYNPKIGSPHVDSVFRTTRTSVDGLEICELFPLLAQQMDKVTLFRARHSRETEHLEGMREHLRTNTRTRHTMLTPMARLGPGLPQVFYSEVPNVNTGFDYRGLAFGVGNCLELPWSRQLQRFLPPDMGPPADMPRVDARDNLRRQLDKLGPRIEAPVVAQMEEHRQRAIEVLRQARDIGIRLDDALVRRYSADGAANPISVGLLTLIELFRRNIVNVAVFRDGFDDVYGGWDQHTAYEARMRRMAPRTDAAYAALLQDFGRGRLPHGLSIVTNQEFGRTKRLNGSGGRDHDPWFCSWIASRQVRGGQVYGSTDARDIGNRNIVNAADYGAIVAQLMARNPDFELRGRYPFFRPREG